MTTGVLMLFTGPQVAGPKGTWVRFVLNWRNVGSSLSPTYGDPEDVQRWLNEEFRVAPQQIADFNAEIEGGKVGTQYYFNLLSDDEASSS